MPNERAREILNFVRQFTREHGYPPTIREIGTEFRIKSTNGVRYYLALLEKSGQLKRSGKISRGIGAVTAPAPAGGRHGYSIPVLGRVAAGQPITAEESYEGSLEPLEMFGDASGLFALRVRGDSMIDAGILENDFVLVRKQDHAGAGEIVVALLEDEATVKFFHPRRGFVELVPANSKYEPIVVKPEAGMRILGVVRGVMRTVGR